ncbi:MAG: hypothetical protein RL755_43 [Pseudomonadota bacterium]|jgi:hypothetical protein
MTRRTIPKKPPLKETLETNRRHINFLDMMAGKPPRYEDLNAPLQDKDNVSTNSQKKSTKL